METGKGDDRARERQTVVGRAEEGLRWRIEIGFWVEGYMRKKVQNIYERRRLLTLVVTFFKEECKDEGVEAALPRRNEHATWNWKEEWQKKDRRMNGVPYIFVCNGV